jgi:NADPH:quinone reductase-like Zn-dependent oxidoreductase
MAQMMKAAVIDRFGPGAELQLQDIPVPQITPDQLLIEVHATSVNPIDWKIADGQMAGRYGREFPMVLGFDVSGVVARAGSNVTGFRPGDAVFARSDNGPGGCYAEFVALNPRTVTARPATLSHAEAAAIPLAGLTALNGLRTVAQLRAGQRALVNGACGGVGVFAVQLARILGAHVTAVCGTDKLALARELGADAVIDYQRGDSLAAGHTFDVIYDTVGALSYPQARERLTEAGLYLTLVPAPGIEFFMPGQTGRKARGGYFVVWTPTAADLKLLGDWAQDRRLRPVIDSVYSLAQINAAHLRSRSLRARGKIVIQVRS